jgi:negative regulator of flagellin synthesis FlgM
MNIGEIKNAASQAIAQYEKNIGANKADPTQVAASQSQAKSAAPLVSPDVKVDFSAQSKEFARMKNAIAELPEVREEKVQVLKTRIENGEYHVDSAKIAEKMVRESLNLSP